MMNTERLRQISPQEFALHGMQDVAYIRRVTVDEAPGFAIHAADGTVLAVLADLDIALVTIRQNDLEPVSLH